MPLHIILSVLHHRKIKAVKACADVLEMLSIAAVTADVDAALRRYNGKAAPLRIIARQKTSRKMLRRQNVDVKIISQRNVSVPVLLVQSAKIKAPLLKKLADTERADDFLHLRLQRHYRIIVEMIPVIVRHEEHIERRNICRCIDIAPAECAVDEKDRRAVSRKYRIDQNAPPADLQIERRVPHPHSNILLARNRMQICFIARDRLLRHAPVIAAEEHTVERLKTVRFLLFGQIVHHRINRLKTDELPVYVMRRCLDPLKTCARRCTPELFLSHKEPDTAGKRADPRQHAKNKISTLHEVPLLNVRYGGPRYKKLSPVVQQANPISLS